MLKGVSESFKNRADSAAFWEAWVAATLARQGLCVLCYPFEIDGKDHSQTFDLDVMTEYPPEDEFGTYRRLKEVEVKSVNIDFESRHSYPFNKVLLCSQNSFLNKWPGSDKIGRDFLIVSRKTGAIVWVPKGTTVELGIDVLDRTRNELYKAVRTDKTNLRGLNEFIKEVKG